MILKGYDGMEREIQDTCQKLRIQKSWVLVLYFYYLQAQQLFFRGKWNFLRQIKTRDRDIQSDLTFEQRKAVMRE